jgi:tRNA A-37 threonylcarbamoyl transferase component Bud32
MSNTVKLNTCPKCKAPIPVEAPQGLCPKCVLLGAATATEQGVPATATSEIPSIPRIAAAFPQLEVLELIGRGGMGFVFKARQPHLDRFVALKLLPDKLAKDAQFAERFNREGRVLAKLSHPNIVSVFDFGETGGFYYLLMEYVDGVNLRQAMRAGRFSPAEALSIVPKVCEALQYAHEQGILHRDIKPENILLDAKGRVKIADFGIAKLVGEDRSSVTLTNTGAALGTPHYMAPEQLEKPSTVDHRADIYSLGVVFYEMLTGELPIGRFAAPSSKTPVGTSVDEVVFRTLEKDRERRFQSAGEMRTQVQDLGEGTGAAPAQASSAHTEQGERSYSRWSIYGALGVGLSLPVPMMIIVSILSGHRGLGPGELWLALGSVALPGIGGTLLGWLGLNEIRENGARVRGLPLAMFATLTWPLFALAGLMVGLPMFLLGPNGGAAASHTLGRILMLVLPAGVVTFVFGAIHATGRWATRQPAPQERGVLKWIFIGMLIVGMGAVLVTRRYRASSAEAAAAAKENAIKAEPMIQFTFTSVELREEAGARWLSMDYVEQVRGDCEQTFRYDARVPGFTAQTRKDSRLSDAKAGFAPVLHQRILWKLPDSLPQTDALALRDLVTKEWIGKSAAIGPDDERLLFKASVPDGGTLAAAVGVRLKAEGASAGPSAEPAAEVGEATNNHVGERGSLKASLGTRSPGNSSDGADSPRKLELRIPTITDDPYKSVGVTTDSELPMGDYLVGVLQRPDGRVEEKPAVMTIYAGPGRTRVMQHLLWSMSLLESNHVREIVAEMRAALDERVIELAPGGHSPVFQAKNARGAVTKGFIALRSQNLPAADLPPVTVSVADVPQNWGPFLSVKLRVSAPPGYYPNAVGLLDDGSRLETHTSIMGGGRGSEWSGDSCLWYFPHEFQKSDVQEIVRQLDLTKVTSPNGIKISPGQRVPMFSVTNKTGTVFRGYFELPMNNGTQ